MKLIIDIPDEDYNRIKEWEDNITGYQTSLVLYRAVRNGIPYDERPQGEWVCQEKGMCVSQYACSICGRTVMDDTGYDVSKDYPFCHCGAKMKGGAENETDN